MTRFSRRLALLLALAPFAGCVPDGVTDFDFQSLQPPAPPVEQTGDALVGSAAAGRFQVELYADRGGAHTGYNVLGVRVAEGGAAIREARVTIEVRAADGPAEGVALPAEAPPTAADADGFFRAGAFLLAPDTTARSFAITVRIEPLSGSAETAAFAVHARADRWQQQADDLLVSWVSPARPVVGNNAFEVAVHRWTGADFVPVSDATASLSPYMDMGGGDGHSTPFTPPQALGGGRYRASVDFIMSGGWEMTVGLARPGAPAATVRFLGFTVYDPS